MRIPFMSIVLALSAMSLPATSWCDSHVTNGSVGASASAAVSLRVVVPPVVQIVKDRHPAAVDAQTDSLISAAQYLEISTNVRAGFCLDLLRSLDLQSTWQVRVLNEAPVTLVAHEGGYRLCAQRSGYFRLTLQHEFRRTDTSLGLMPWPVRTDLAVI